MLKSFEHLPGYIGIDVSANAIASNIENFPNRRFECLDFVSHAGVQGLRSDVVLCLEVLIHQHRREQYDGLVKNLVACAAKGGLVSAYIFNPRPHISSDIIAWHEPITGTLYRAGAKSVVVEARSLESDCLAFVSFKT